jgi:hypothetical protein
MRMNPAGVRKLVGDGNYHGVYERPDAEMHALWQVAVEETRGIIEHGWPCLGAFQPGGIERMVGFLIQRLLQAAVVMLIISALVFVGVFAIGNPIDVLISPDATQQIRRRHDRALRPRPAAVGAVLRNFLSRLVQGISAAPSSSTCRCST